MAKITKPKGRYEIRDILGEGGMGVVYRAFDPILKREVTLKTIRDPQDTVVLELFKRECAVLAGMAHPNIVDILDIGETDDGTGRRPYFVMPLLKGVTLDQLIRSASPRLSVERSVQMITGMCRGLQAAHDQGLVHRDLKPGNIFVLEDDSIKIIDFGVAHLTDQRSVTGLKGTLLYMAPEQLQLKKPTPVSDQFSLAVIGYEMLTKRHPFNVPGHEDLTQAILTYSPPAASDINPLVPPLVSQVIHKALTKEPFHRFANVREYADCLQKALRNEPIEIFNPSRVEPRLVRAQKAFADGDVDFAGEIIRELKSESYLNPEIDRLDKEISDASRNKSVKQLLDTARRRFDEHEHVLALQKVQEVIDLDPANLDAITLRNNIEVTRSSTQVEEWLRLAQQHLDNRAYTHARQAMEKLLEQRPDDARAQAFLGEIDRQEQDSARLKAEKRQAYELALESFKRGDVNSALSKLERCLEADRLTPQGTSPDEATSYQKLYEEVRSKRDQLKAQEEETKKLLAEGKYDAALNICTAVLKEYPENLLFGFLRGDAEQGQRIETSGFVVKVEKEVAEEGDLNSKIAILEDAKARYPDEQRFEQSLRQVRSRKDLVDSIVTKAQALEDGGQFSEAYAQWETLSNIHPQYPGLKVEMERLTRRRQQQAQAGAKAGWVAQIDQAVNIHNFTRASTLVKEALVEFPGDSELLALEQTIAQLSARLTEAEDQLAQAKALDQAGKTDLGLELLRSAYALAPQQQSIRNGLIDLLLKQAGALLDSNWTAAEPFVAEAATIEPKNALAKSLKTLIADKKQAEDVALCLSQARALQGQGKSREAIRELDQALAKYPRETRIIQLRASLGRGLSTGEREELRTQDLQELRKLEELSRTETDARGLDTIFERTRVFRTKYAEDKEFSASITAIEERVTDHGARKVPVDPIQIDDSDHTRMSGGGRGKREKDAPPPAKALNSKTSPSPRMIQLFYGLAGTIAAGLLLFLIISLTSSSNNPAPVAQRVPITVTIAGVPYRIEDSSGKDVTDEANSGGLNPGDYRLRATRAGFAPIDSSFKIQAGEKEHPLNPVWQMVPIPLTIHASRPGQGTLDGAPLLVGATGDLTGDLTAGTHHITWVSGPFSAEVDIEAKDGAVTKKSWITKPPIAALWAITGLQKAEFEAINLEKLVINGQPQPATSTTLDLAAGQTIEIKSVFGTLLAQLKRADDAKAATLLLNMVPPGAGAKIAPKPGAIATPATSPEVVTPAPAGQAPAPPEEPKGESALDRLRKRARGQQ